MATMHRLVEYAKAHGVEVLEIGPDYIICDDASYDAKTMVAYHEPSERIYTLTQLRNWLGY